MEVPSHLGLSSIARLNNPGDEKSSMWIQFDKHYTPTEFSQS